MNSVWTKLLLSICMFEVMILYLGKYDAQPASASKLSEHYWKTLLKLQKLFRMAFTLIFFNIYILSILKPMTFRHASALWKKMASCS
jgi:hypothetical protein